ncbi:uncharacterized protein LOC112692807 isoform X2 [Sipha flava]|nr:uncharacterized protein LOC112692807 isoform X2 [Sipha flava]
MFTGPKLAPAYRTNDIDKLVQYIMNEADVIKIAAYNRLKELYRNKSRNEQMNYLVPFMQSAIEVVKSHGANNSLMGIKHTYLDAIYYTYKCLKGEKNAKERARCYKWRALFLAACFFSNKIKQCFFIRHSFNSAYREAIKIYTDDKMLKYARIKIACKVKLAVQGRNIISKSLISLYLGSTSKQQQLDCPSRLLEFEESIRNYESYTEEFYYLVGQSFAKNGYKEKALEYFKKGRKFPIIDQKGRYISQQLQKSIENIYTC